MDTLLIAGDFATGLLGRPVSIQGIKELVQQCMIHLSVPRGSFALDKSLGSRLHTLPKASGAVLDRLAQEYMDEALEDIPQVQTLDVSCKYDPKEDRITIETQLAIGQQSYNLEVSL